MKKLRLFFAVLLIFSSFLFLGGGVRAQSAEEQRLQEIQKQINELEGQLNEAKGQEKTLQSQLKYIDTQTKITELKIDETNTQIEKLGKEIDDLAGRITKLSTTVDSISELLLNRITQTYKYGDISPVELFFSSSSFSDILQNIKYIQVAQANDKKVLYQLQATKATYNDQKTDKQTRQVQQEKLKKDLIVYQDQLVVQKKAKGELLRITQNNEAIYQAKIRAAQEEQNAILSIFSGRGNEVALGPVSKGATIGTIISGRSPCSSGTHLHFEVRQNNSTQDPSNFLSNTGFAYFDNDGGKDEGAISPHGSWDWPIDQQIIITQGFGMTPYAQAGAYNGGPHTGIDMYSSSNSSAKAVKDGTLSRGGIACGGGTLNYKKVDHGDGTSTYYLHVY